MEVTGVVLAGGKGQRMGGVDKGLILFQGKPLVAHVADRLKPQVDRLLINANRELEAYRQLGYPVVSDDITGFIGPLAGLHRGMRHAATLFVVTVPCDAPFLPADLVGRLQAALVQHAADVAVVKTSPWRQPVFSLCRTTLLPDLTRFLQGGGRKVDAWYARLNTVEVSFDDQPAAFTNINTPEELACLEH